MYSDLGHVRNYSYSSFLSMSSSWYVRLLDSQIVQIRRFGKDEMVNIDNDIQLLAIGIV